ncbi:MAG: DUF1659 domain-containing protein [Acidaminococcaceae bacterium]|nr:DUF1659 domain-containing protein [Acidaminococcaceae bacterium]
MTSVEKTLLGRTLTISVNNGVSASGSTKLKNRSFSSINPEATDDDIYNTAKALGGLMTDTVMKVIFSDKNLLQEVEEE